MGKKLLFPSVLLSVSTLGTHAVFADTIEPTTNSNVQVVQPAGDSSTIDSQGSTNSGSLPSYSLSQVQNQSSSAKQNSPNINTDQQGSEGSSTPTQSTDKDNVPAVTTNQDQSTSKNVNQSQDTTGNPNAVQKQNTDVADCQNQTPYISASCQEQNGNDVTGDLNQSEATSINAEQLQSSSLATKKVKLEQNQSSDLASDESQTATVPSGVSDLQSQKTSATVSQNQTAKASKYSSILQGQLLGMNNVQEQQLKPVGSLLDKQSQETSTKELQTQQVTTSGSASLKQVQTVKAKENITDESNESIVENIKEKSVNFIKIIKDSVVKVVQKIFVNDKLVGVNKSKYTLDETQSNAFYQEYDGQYNGGTLQVINSAIVDFNQQVKSIEATVNSFVNLDFIGELIGERSGLTSSTKNLLSPNTNKSNPPETSISTDKGGSTHNDTGNQQGNPIISAPVVNKNSTKSADSANKDRDSINNTPAKNDGSTSSIITKHKGEHFVTPTPKANKGDTSDSNEESKNNVNTTPVLEKNSEPHKLVADHQEQKSSVSGQNNKETTAASIKSGNTLPNTGTYIYDFLLLGAILITGGLVLLFLRKRA